VGRELRGLTFQKAVHGVPAMRLHIFVNIVNHRKYNYAICNMLLDVCRCIYF